MALKILLVDEDPDRAANVREALVSDQLIAIFYI